VSELATEARVEVLSGSMGTWLQRTWSAIGVEPGGVPSTTWLPPSLPIPEAVVEGVAMRRYELQLAVFPDEGPARPVRVIDSAGVVVAQWGHP
jgi:hypothetical protein